MIKSIEMIKKNEAIIIIREFKAKEKLFLL
jgi:hypothetical protein